MNTKPDDQLLARWVDDELSDAARDEAEAWAAGRPEWLARRDEARACRALLGRALPATEEPPYPEFFQARIERAVRVEAAAAAANRAVTAPRRAWWSLGGALAAAAAMAFCFWAGTHFAPQGPALPVASRPPPAPGSPATSVYVPEQGVQAKVFEASGSEGIVIVLDGVEAIPDSFEIPEQAGLPSGGGSSSTAAAKEAEIVKGRRQ
jgi:hypothetical protein